MQALGAQQVECFRRFGFALLPDHFAEAKRHDLLADIDGTIAALKAANEQDGSGGYWSPMLSPETAPSHVSLLGRDGFYPFADQLFEKPFYGMSSDFVLTNGDTWWHRDQDVPCEVGIKFIYYLGEPLTADSGALCVIPGSHLQAEFNLDIPESMHKEALPSSALGDDTLAATMQRLQGLLDEHGLFTACIETGPRDVIAFTTPLYHASFNGGAGRLLCSTIYQQTPTDDVGWQQRRDDCKIIRKQHEQARGWPVERPFHPPDWIAQQTDETGREWVACLTKSGWIE